MIKARDLADMCKNVKKVAKSSYIFSKSIV